MEGVKAWEGLGIWLGFGVEDTGSIKRQHDSDEACLKAVVEKFLHGEGLYQPSWRRVIYSLDRVDELELADKIRSFGEPVQGECTCSYSIEMVIFNTANGFIERSNVFLSN